MLTPACGCAGARPGGQAGIVGLGYFIVVRLAAVNTRMNYDRN